MFDIPLFPARASTMAGRVDALFFFLIGVTVFFSVLIAAAIVYFAIKYRRRSPDEIGTAVRGIVSLEIAWTVIPFAITMILFVWGASLFLAQKRPPDDTLNVYVVGKQWMWKFQHLDGRREINELHVPVGRAVKLIMTSEDVIHDLSIPAFRIKQDVLPGRYTVQWFEATQPGSYHLFCSQYCGTSHSRMTGQVIAMEPAAYKAWLAGGAGEGSFASAGEKLFADFACMTCHQPDSEGRGPVLTGLFGRAVQLQDKGTATFDEVYIRESILNPAAKVVAGYQPIMPTFQGLVSEEQLLQLVEYVKSLGTEREAPPAHPAPAGPAPGETAPMEH